MASPYRFHQATGSGAMAETITPSETAFQIDHLRVKVGVAAATAENLTITIDDGTGAAYDVVVLTQAMATYTSVVWSPDRPIPCKAGDKIVAAWTNTDGRTWGLTVYWTQL